MGATLSNIQTLKAQSMMTDLALGFEPEIEVTHKWSVLERYAKAGINYVGLAIAGEFTSLENTIRYLSRNRAHIQNNADKYRLVENVEDILIAKQQNKLALGFWLQGSFPLANDINMVETYYQLGVRSLLLTYNTRNSLGDGVIEKNDNGLSELGKKIIQEMNRVGMLIDLSHASIKTSLEAIEISTAPVIFSHSNAYEIMPHVRNLQDEQIKAVGARGGIIGANGAALLLGTDKSSSRRLVDHIDYIMNLLGSDQHVALGLDYIYFQEILPLFFEKAGITTYPAGYLDSMDSLHPEKIDEIIEELLRRSYSELTIKNILGENFLRIANDVWK